MLQSSNIYAYKISHNKGLASNESLENNTSVLLGCSDSQSPYLFNKMLQPRQHNAVELTPANNQEEIWKDIPDYEGYYQVSNFGNVKSLSRTIFKMGKFPFISKEKILKPRVNKGYKVFNLCKNGHEKTRKVHQLVAMAFLNHVPCGYKLVVNHKDFNKLNNNISNLEIVTMRENTNQKHIKSSSEFTGVYWHKATQKWMARIRVNGKRKYLGLFSNEKDASLAYENSLIAYLKVV